MYSQHCAAEKGQSKSLKDAQIMVRFEQDNLNRLQHVKNILSLILSEMKCTLKQWAHNYQTRQQLQQLDERQLNDMGISRADMIEETSKRFWKD